MTEVTWLTNPLPVGSVIQQGQGIVSPSGNTALVLLTSGQFAIFKDSDNDGQLEAISFFADFRYDIEYVALQSDSNIVGYNANNVAVDSTGLGKSSPVHLRVQDDGNIIYENASGGVVWASNTTDPAPLGDVKGHFTDTGGGGTGTSGDGAIVGGTGPDTLHGASGDDLIYGGAGVDHIGGYRGNDTIYAGAGNDSVLHGYSGDDHIFGGSGDDTLLGQEGDDSLDGDSGDDRLAGSSGDDTLKGGTGNDSIDGGEGRDLAYGGTGNDTIVTDATTSTAGPESADTAYGGQGDDWIHTFNGNDLVYAGSGDDSVNGERQDDTINGGTGRDTLTGASGDDILYGGSGDDVNYGGQGDDTIGDGPGNDYLEGGSGDDDMYGGVGTGNDTLYGQIGNDSLVGGSGDDRLFGGEHNDTLEGGPGHDSLDGGTGHDSLLGGAGRDTLVGAAGDDYLDGQSGDDLVYGGSGDDTLKGTFGNDTLDGGTGNNLMNLSGLTSGGQPVSASDLVITDTGAGYVDTDTGRITFSNITHLTLDGTTILPLPDVCFCRGTLIETAQGPVAVENLTPGMLVRTRDNGMQPIAWVGHKPSMGRPVRIRAGALGNTRDLLVSPRHRMVLSGWQLELLFDHSHALITALELVNDTSIVQDPLGPVDYYHVMFDAHEIIYAEGAETESFHPDQPSMGAMDAAARAEIFALFPELEQGENRAEAAPSLNPYEAAYIAKNLTILGDKFG